MVLASELVETLQDLIKEHGDLEVVNEMDQEIEIELNLDTEKKVFVIV